MSISSITQFISGQYQELQKADARNQGALEKIAQKVEQSAFGEDAAEISDAQQLQSKASGFRKAAANATQAGDILKIAGSALARIEQKLSRFKEAGAASAEDITQLRNDVDAIVQSTQFSEKPLLDGNFSSPAGGELPDVRSQSLLSGLDVGSLEQVDAALNFVRQQQQDITTQQNDVETVAAVFEVSAQNQEAAQAVFPSADELSLLEQVISQQQSVSAQTNRLQPNILNLIQS